MQGNVRLILELLVALLVAQAGLWLLARLLGARLRVEAIVAGLALPWLVLAPWIGGKVLLAPTQALAGQVPGTPPPAVVAAHAVELNDAVFQFLPWELEVRHAFAARRLPLWSNLVDGGSSPWSNPTAQVLSPIAMLARWLPIQHHLLAALALKMLIALQGAWVLGRGLGLRRPAALVVGCSFALSGGIFAWAVFPQSAVAAWVPWCVAGGLVLARRPGRAAMLATAGAFAALLLEGHPEVALAGGLLAVLVAICFARRRRWFKAVLPLAVAGTLGAGLAAPVVLPFLHLLPLSQRLHEHLERGSPPTPAGETAPWFKESKGRMLRAPANPLAYGKPYREPFRGAIGWTIAETMYAGLAVFLGCCMLPLARRRAWALPFIAFAGLALLLATDFRPLVRLWFLLPPLRLPEYARFLPVAVLALAVAGGFGLEALARRRRAAVLALGGAACALSFAAAPRLEIVPAWLLLGAALFAGGRRRWLAGMLAVAAIACDLVPWARWMLPLGDPALFYPRTPEVATVIAETPPAYRAIGQDMLSYPSVLPFYGVAEPRAHNPLVPDDYVGVLRAAFGFSPSTVEYFSPLRRLDHPLRRFLGVRTIISNRYLPVPAGVERLPEVEGHATVLYRDEAALPRLFAAGGVDTIARQDIAAWIAAMQDPRRVAVFAEELGDWPLPPRLQAPVVEIVRLDRGAIELTLPPQGAKLVATSIPGPPGWSARSGERPLRTLTVNGAFLGVLVPGRLGSVQLEYHPPGMLAGAGMALLSVLGLGAVALAPARWLRPQPLREAVLLVALAAATAALAWTVKNRLDRLGAPPTAHPRAPHRWAWGTPPPEAVRALVLAATPWLDKDECRVGLAGPWTGEEALFPPLWAAYFLPRCDVVPLTSPSSDGPVLRIVAGDPPAESDLGSVAALPGGGLYRKRR